MAMPYKITESEYVVRVNTGFPKTWTCSVPDCTHFGYDMTEREAELSAARHSVSHTETELVATGYRARINYAALAAERLSR